MGTVKYTGPVASFHCPTNAEIRSLKVHFSPKQEGSGDPSPENVREIVGWDGVEQYYSGKNVGHIVGYCATTLYNPYNKKIATNTYGTTLSTVDQERSVTITQSQAPETSNISHYKNGYMAIELDNLKYDETYDISFKVINITSNPLNATLQNLGLGVPNGTRRAPTEIRNNVLIYKNISFKQRDSFPNQMDFDLRICGMSFTLSDFMVTPAGMNDGVYEPYTDKRIVKWNQWSLPLTDENWRAYNTSNNNVQFENGVATSTWLNNTQGYSASIKTKTGILQKNKEIWYISYMVKASMAGGSWGIEYNGGLQETAVTNEEADVWYQCSRSNIYCRGTRNYVYICYYRGGITEHTGMIAQVKSPLMINLTQMFGSGNEPTKEEFEEQCALNGIDLTSALPYNEGSIREWKTNGELLKNNITFPILGKNKFNINSSLAEPSNTNLTGSRIFQPYTYCLGLTTGNSYSPDKITDCSITNNTLTFTTNNTSYGVLFAIPSLYGIYRLSYTGENVSPTVIRYDNEGNLTYSGSSLDSQGIIAIGPDVSITGVLFRSVTANTPTTVSNIQIEEGTAVTEYEEFNPNHTVYGGWVDLITGEVQEEYKLLDKPWSEWGNKTTFGDGTELRYIRFEAPVKGNGTSNFKTSLCNVAKYLYGNENGTTHYYIVGNSYNCRVYLPTGTDENTRVQVLGELVTPITYHLAPTGLQTFLGQNNVWSNADYVEVEYDLHETQDILARKQFIVANQPHLVSPAAAPMQSFTTDLVAPLKECKVYFEPKQDLHGYDRPWVGGSGKNLFNINAPYAEPSNITSANTTNRIFTAGTHFIGIANNNYINKNAVTNASINDTTISVTATSGYGYGFALKLTPGQTYYLSGTSSSSASFTYYNSNGEVISYQGARLNKATTIPENADITLLTFISSGGATNTWSNIQLELGSTATSYEPYENICPISGWTGLEVTRCGKNLFNKDTVINNSWIRAENLSEENPLGTIRENARGYTLSSYIPVYSNTTYTIKYNISSLATAAGMVFFSEQDANSAISGISLYYQTYINSSITREYYTFTTPTNCHYIRITTPPNASEVQLELGSTATEYEPYIGTTIPITFPATTSLLTKTTLTTNKTLDSNGEIISETGMTVTDFIKVNEGETYKLTFTSKEGARTRRIYSYDSNKDPIESLASTSWVTVDTIGTIQATIPSGVEYIRVCYKTADENIFLEGPESFTIYGGYVDLANGELVQTWNYIRASERTWSNYSAYQVFYTNKSDRSADSRDISDKLKSYTGYGWANAPDNSIISGNRNSMFIKHLGVSSNAEFKEWLDEVDPIIYYELVEPIHYTLTPTQLKTLRGTNNIWSNANGDITVQFWRH